MLRVAQARLASHSWIGVVDNHRRCSWTNKGHRPQSGCRVNHIGSQAAQSGSALRQCLFDVIPGRNRSV